MKEYAEIDKKSEKDEKIRRRRDTMWRMGEEAQQRKKKESSGQSELQISDPGDAQELEADSVARKVMGGQSTSVNSNTETVQPQAKHESKNVMAGGELQNTLDSSKGGGQGLDDATKSEMGSKMGADLGEVKIHTDDKAHTMAEGIKAKAFTHGQDIYFKQGNYNTDSGEGKELLAHELAHTVQQKEGGISRSIQRAAISPKQFAKNYFSDVAGYSWEKLKTYLGSDGSSEQNNQLQKLLSALIHSNSDLSPAKLWGQLSIDITQLKGYKAFQLYEGGSNTLPQFKDTALSLHTVADPEAGLSDLTSGTIDYERRRYFIFGKKKKEEKRKAASEKASLFLQETAKQMELVVNEATASKHQLESDLQAFSTSIHQQLASDAEIKRAQAFGFITRVSESAALAKVRVEDFYQGSLTVIDNNTETQKARLGDYAEQAFLKLNELESNQFAEIDAVYTNFYTDIQKLADVKKDRAIEAGGARHKKLEDDKSIKDPLLKEGKQHAVVNESQKVVSEIQVLADKNKSDAVGLDDQIEAEGFKNASEPEAHLLKTDAQMNIFYLVESTKGLLDERAIADKSAALSLKDAYDSKIDDLSILIIDSFSLALEAYYKKLGDFGISEDAAIGAFYQQSVGDLTAATQDKVQTVKTKLETFQASQKGLRTPKAKKLQAQIDLVSSDVTPVISQASAGVNEAIAKHTAGRDELKSRIQAGLDQIEVQGTESLLALFDQGMANIETMKQGGIDDQLTLREDHLHRIIRDVRASKKSIDNEIDILNLAYQDQLTTLDAELKVRLETFEAEANKILAGLEKRMDQAEKQADKDLASGKLQRDKNVRSFAHANMLLTGTEDCYKVYTSYLAEMKNVGGVVASDGMGGAVWVPIPGSVSRADQLKAELEKLAQSHGFKGADDYIQVVEDFEIGYRQTASAIALEMIEVFEKKLVTAEADLSNRNSINTLFKELAPYRAEVTKGIGYQNEANKYAGRPVSEEDQVLYDNAAKNMHGAEANAKKLLQPLYDRYPLFDDQSRDEAYGAPREAIAKADTPEKLQEVLLKYIADRKADVKSAKEHVLKEEGSKDVYDMDNVLAIVNERYAITKNSVQDKIITHAISEKRTMAIIIGVIIAIVAIAVIILTWGAAAPIIADVAAVSLIVDGYFFLDAIKQYERDKSFAGSGLISEDPSMIWVILAGVGLVLGATSAFKAFKAIQPFSRSLDATGALAKFNKALDLLETQGQLDLKLSNRVRQAAAARQGYYDSVKGLRKVIMQQRLYHLGIDPEAYTFLVKMAGYKIKEGVINFSHYLISVKNVYVEAKLMKIEQEFAPTDLAQIKKAWQEALEGVEKGVVLSSDDVLRSVPGYIDGTISRLSNKSEYVLNGTGEYRIVEGHHPLAKSAFRDNFVSDADFVNFYRDGFSVSRKTLEEVTGIKNIHSSITGQQNSLYSAFKKTGKVLTLDDMAEIEIKAMTNVGIPENIATGWVVKALEKLKLQGVKKITNIPWNTTNP